MLPPMAPYRHGAALALLVILLAASQPLDRVSAASHHHRPTGVKSLHFSLFQHETINRTAYIIVNGISGTGVISQTTTPFGTLYAFQDPVTVSANRSSRVVGVVEGTSVTTRSVHSNLPYHPIQKMVHRKCSCIGFAEELQPT